MASSEMTFPELTVVDRNSVRPPLNRSDVYRPRLGAQKQPLAITTMSETRAWRELSSRDADAVQPERGA